MSNEWADFLQTQHAHSDEIGVSHFADDPATADNDTNFICDLSQLGILRINGDDAETFLQGQLSNDVNLLDGKQSQLSSYCSPKGRILASFRLYRADNDFYLLIPTDTLVATQKRLRMFVLMSKVTIDDVSDELVRFGISGEKANTALKQLSLPVPTTENELASKDSVHILAIPSAHPRYILVAPVTAAPDMWNSLKEQLPAKGYNHWNLMDIQQGIPSIVASTVDAFVPQMVNLHAINGVSFSKGCYPGQEIVARMHYLGKLKRRMYRAHVKTDQAPTAGDALFSADSDSGQGAGQIVMSAALADGHYEVLAVMQIKAYEESGLHLHNNAGPKLEPRDIPYTVSLEREK